MIGLKILSVLRKCKTSIQISFKNGLCCATYGEENPSVLSRKRKVCAEQDKKDFNLTVSEICSRELFDILEGMKTFVPVYKETIKTENKDFNRDNFMCYAYITLLDRILSMFLTNSKLVTQIKITLTTYLQNLITSFRPEEHGDIHFFFRKIVERIFILCLGIASVKNTNCYKIAILGDGLCFNSCFWPFEKDCYLREPGNQTDFESDIARQIECRTIEFKSEYDYISNDPVAFMPNLTYGGERFVILFSLVCMVSELYHLNPDQLLARMFYNYSNLNLLLIKEFNLGYVWHLCTASAVKLNNNALSYFQNIRQTFYTPYAGDYLVPFKRAQIKQFSLGEIIKTILRDEFFEPPARELASNLLGLIREYNIAADEVFIFKLDKTIYENLEKLGLNVVALQLVQKILFVFYTAKNLQYVISQLSPPNQ